MSKLDVGITDGVAVLTLANPPVNSLGHELRRELLDALERAEEDAGVCAVILIGSGKGFSGGADIREFGTAKASAPPDLRALIRAVEQLGKPVIAAIDGICMGGGLELALSCHHRMGAVGAQLALPEVKLGLIPGAGGTQRLPRLIGAERALCMIVSGATVSAEKLRDSGLFDAFAERDLAGAALAYARKIVAQRLDHDRTPYITRVPDLEWPSALKRVRDIEIDMPNAEAYFQFARDTVRATAGAYPAPLACVEAVAGAVQKPFDVGLAYERELFAGLLLSPESAALRHVFQAERAAAHIRDVPHDTPVRPIRRVGVVGAGTMGGGITMAIIDAGVPVVLLENTREALDRGLATIRRNYQGALRRETLDAAGLETRLALITPTLDYGPLRDVDLVIEAVFESMDVKQTVFEKLDAVVRPGAILASNTSALNLDSIARFTRRPQDVIGLHFFSPANVMRLLEVVRGAATSRDVLATAMRFAKQLGKVAVVSGVCDGFIGNRMVMRYGAAAHDLILEGAMPQDVDAALQEFGMAMGPFRMGDLAGLDIGWALRKRRAAESPTRDFSHVADDLCEAGRFGQKTGAGWYRYESGSRNAIPDPAVSLVIDKYRRLKGITPRQVSSGEIVERCVYALVNEGARLLEEGIARSSGDIDVVYLNGYGFPAYRGGPMFYADQTGLTHVAHALRRIAALPGSDAAFWTPAPLLDRLAREGGTFTAFKVPAPFGRT